MPRLTISKKGRRRTRDVDFDDLPVTIGRASGSTVKLHDVGVSRHHAEIVMVDGRAIARDLESTHGIKVNGRRVEEAAIAHGAKIRVGPYELLLEDPSGSLGNAVPGIDDDPEGALSLESEVKRKKDDSNDATGAPFDEAAALQRRIGELQTEVEQWRRNSTRASQRADELEERGRDFEADAGESVRRLHAIEVERDHMAERARKAEVIQKELEAKVARLAEAAVAPEEALQRARAKAEGAEHRATEAEQTLAVHVANEAAHADRLTALTQEIDTARQAHEEREVTLASELDDARDHLAQRDAAEAAGREAVAAVEAERDVATARIAQLGEELAELTSRAGEASSLAEAREALTAELAAITVSRDELRTALDVTSDEHEALRLERDGLRGKLESLRTESADRSGALDELRASLETTSAERDAVQIERDAAREQLETVRAESDARATALDELRAEHERRGAELEAARQSVEDAAGKLEPLETTMAERAATVTSLAAERDELLGTIRAHEERLLAMQTTVTTLQTQRDTGAQEQSALETSVEQLRARLETEERARASLEELLDEATSSEEGDAAVPVHHLIDQREAGRQRIEALESQLQAAQTARAKSDAMVEALETRRQAIERRLQASETARVEATTKCQRALERVEGHRAEMVRLEHRFQETTSRLVSYLKAYHGDELVEVEEVELSREDIVRLQSEGVEIIELDQ